MKIVYTVVVAALLFGGCSPYQKLLKSEDTGEKYHVADSLYNAGKYKKALKLMEQIVPAYRGKPQAEKLMFIYSDTYYQLGDYYIAGYQFERFVTSYPTSQKAEEAAFKAARSFYELSPRYSLDQEDTFTALEKLQEFINTYPDSDRLKEANTLVAELTTKIEKKRFEVAKQYYHVEDYKAAIKAFDNFILEYAGSVYRAEAYFLRFKAAYDLAVRSLDYLVAERLEEAKKYYNSFSRYYPDSEFQEEANALIEDINKQLENNEV